MTRLPALIAALVLVTAVALVVVAVIVNRDRPAQPAEAATAPEIATAPEPDPPATTAVPPIIEISNEEIWQLANEVVGAPTIDNVGALAFAMGQSGDAGWFPYVLDLLRFYGVSETLPAIVGALSTLSGEPLPDEIRLTYAAYGRWMHREKPFPYDPGGDGQGYIAWKSLLYSQVDVAFAELLGQVDDPILASQIQWGGVLRGGIPELNAPATLSVDEADWMVPDELTFGAVINGEIRAYPHRILDHHEMANDTLGGEPVALANCTLCRTGILFSRRVGDQVLMFQSSGLLWNSNKVMVDIETDSLWNQLTGEAIAGPLDGTVLERFPVTVTAYGEWIAEHPETSVLDIPGRTAEQPRNEIRGGGYSYEPGDAYASYYASPDVWWPAAEVPNVFGEKDLVATLDVDGERLAVGIDALDASGPQVFTIAGRQVVAVPTAGGARFYGPADNGVEITLTVESAGEDTLLLANGAELERLVSGHSFWFAWYANFPDTGWWPG